MDKKMQLVLCHRDKNGRHWDGLECRFDGPGRIRTYDQGIHLTPSFPAGVDYLFTRALTVRVGAGCSAPVIKDTLSPQVVSAPSAGAPAAWLRIAMGWKSPEGFPEFIPSTSRVSTRRHLIDESPALTAVLQAQRPAIVAAPLPQK
jgi:hypothetical protein